MNVDKDQNVSSDDMSDEEQDSSQEVKAFKVSLPLLCSSY